MICPVCEHQQEFGLECEVCGKALGGLDGLGAPPAREERLEGLESTELDGGGEVAVLPLDALEVTRYEPAAATGPGEVLADVEHTAAPAVGEVTVEPLTDFSADRAAFEGVRTARPTGPIICRYCRTPNAGGSLCERCGMKLPVAIVVPQLGAVAVYDPEDLKVRCTACGAPAKAGQRCGDCGKDIPLPGA